MKEKSDFAAYDEPFENSGRALLMWATVFGTDQWNK